MLKYFLILSFLSGITTAQTRTFRNSNLDGNLQLCVNDGGNKNSCPIVITGSTGNVAITGTTLTNVAISSLTALSGNDIEIDAGTGETSLQQQRLISNAIVGLEGDLNITSQEYMKCNKKHFTC